MAGWEALKAVLEVIDVLEDLGVPHHVGGSLASSVHGVPRQTNVLDLVADLPVAVAADLARRLGQRFYIDVAMIVRAIQRRGSFNLVHLATGFKVDIFIQGRQPFDRMEFARHGLHQLDELPRDLMVKSAEDTVLRKLEWRRRGGEVSDRQWTHILGIVRTRGDELDRDYLDRWAQQLGVADLLSRVARDVDTLTSVTPVVARDPTPLECSGRSLLSAAGVEAPSLRSTRRG